MGLWKCFYKWLEKTRATSVIATQTKSFSTVTLQGEGEVLGQTSPAETQLENTAVSGEAGAGDTSLAAHGPPGHATARKIPGNLLVSSS